jgi:hypothetical protein
VLTVDTTVTWSLPGESNPVRLPTEEACLPLPLGRHCEPFPGAGPGGWPLQGAGARWREGRACPRCDSNAHFRRTQRRASCHWATRTPSRHPVPTRAFRCTRAEPQPCAAAWLGNLDSNQDKRVRLPVQSRACCQLHHSPLVRRLGLEPRTTRVRVGSTSACACGAWSRTGESNPDVLRGRQAS